MGLRPSPASEPSGQAHGIFSMIRSSVSARRGAARFLLGLSCLVVCASHAAAREPDTAVLVQRFHNGTGEPASALFTPSGRDLICAMDHRVTIWSVRSRQPRNAAKAPQWSCRLRRVLKTNIDVRSLSVSADGRYLAATLNPRGAFVWDLHSNAIVKRLMLKRNLGAVAFAPRGHVLALSMESQDSPPQWPDGATGSVYNVHVIDVDGWRLLKFLHSTAGMPAVDLAWSRDGRLLAADTYYGDAGVGELFVWRVRDERTIYHYPPDNMPGAFDVDTGLLFFVGDTYRLVSGNDWINLGSRQRHTEHVVRQSDGESERSLVPFGPRNDFVVIDHYAGMRVNTADFTGPYRVWDPFTQRAILKFRIPKGHLDIVAASPYAPLFVAAYDQPAGPNTGELRLYSIAGKHHAN